MSTPPPFLDWLEECAREDYWYEINGEKSAELLAYIRKLQAVVEAGDEIFSYLKAYSSEHGGRVGQVPPGFEYKMHDAMGRWAEARAALREETK